MQQVLGIKDDLIEGFYAAGAALYDVGRYAEAEEVFYGLALLQPSKRNWYVYGAVLQMQGKYAAAMEAYGQILRISPEVCEQIAICSKHLPAASKVEPMEVSQGSKKPNEEQMEAHAYAWTHTQINKIENALRRLREAAGRFLKECDSGEWDEYRARKHNKEKQS